MAGSYSRPSITRMAPLGCGRFPRSPSCAGCGAKTIGGTAPKRRGLLPGTPIGDTGVLDAELLVESQDQYGVDLLGPTRLDDHWQARAGAGFDAQHFQIDGDQHHATCPAGKTSTGWTPAIDNRGNPVITVRFSTRDGRHCDQLAQCVRSTKRDPRRTLTIWPQPHYQALQAARQREATAAFQAEYDRRAGIEGTISRGIRSTRLRRTRYRGLARVFLGHILTAVGLNVLRLGEWFLETAPAKTRITPFARLMADTPAALPAETSPSVSKVTMTQDVLTRASYHCAVGVWTEPACSELGWGSALARSLREAALLASPQQSWDLTAHEFLP
jgi:Transposase DDE domain